MLSHGHADLNQIQTLGPYKYELRQRRLARISDELFATLEDIWIGIDVAPFTASVHRRLQTVVSVYGGHIKYQFNHHIVVVNFVMLLFIQYY